MKLSIPALLALLFIAAPARRAVAADDLDQAKGSSGEKFLETGGKGGVSSGNDSAVDTSGGTGNREAMDLVNGESAKTKLDGKDVPAPKGDALAKGVGVAKGAAYGAVILGTIGGVVGIIGGPAGILGGVAGGVKLGAMAGMAIGAGFGFLMAGKSSSPGVIENRQSQLDNVLKGM